MTFKDLLLELGEQLGLELAPDDHGTCLLLFEGRTQVQLEPADNQLIIGLIVGHVPAGRGREKLFQAALIANGNHLPGTGIFAYSSKTDQLILFDMIPLEGLTGRDLAAYLDDFLVKGIAWQEAVQRGTLPDPNAPVSGSK